MKLMRNAVVLLFILIVFCVGIVTAQDDPGVRDTVRFEPGNTTWTINSQADSAFSVEVWGWSDSPLGGCSLPFIIHFDTVGYSDTLNSGLYRWGLNPDILGQSSIDTLIVLDSFVWIGSGQVDSVPIKTINASLIDPSKTTMSPKQALGYNGFLLGLVKFTSPWSCIPFETSAKIGELYFTFFVDDLNAPVDFMFIVDTMIFETAGTYKFTPVGATQGHAPHFVPCTLHVSNPILDADDLDSDLPPLPQTYELNQNYPNPFNPTTTIKFYNEKTGHVKLEIYNIMGQKVRTLIDTDLDVGWQETVWDGNDNYGNSTASGIYFYKMTASSFTETKKMLMLK